MAESNKRQARRDEVRRWLEVREREDLTYDALSRRSLIFEGDPPAPYGWTTMETEGGPAPGGIGPPAPAMATAAICVDGEYILISTSALKLCPNILGHVLIHEGLQASRPRSTAWSPQQIAQSSIPVVDVDLAYLKQAKKDAPEAEKAKVQSRIDTMERYKKQLEAAK